MNINSKYIGCAILITLISYLLIESYLECGVFLCLHPWNDNMIWHLLYTVFFGLGVAAILGITIGLAILLIGGDIKFNIRIPMAKFKRKTNETK